MHREEFGSSVASNRINETLLITRMHAERSHCRGQGRQGLGLLVGGAGGMQASRSAPPSLARCTPSPAPEMATAVAGGGTASPTAYATAYATR